MHCLTFITNVTDAVPRETIEFLHGNISEKPSSKRVKISDSSECDIPTHNETLQNFFTIAKINLEFKFSNAQSRNLSAPTLPFQKSQQVSVAIKALDEQARQIYVTTFDSRLIFKANLPPAVDQRTLEILKTAEGLYNSRRSSNAKAHTLIYVSSFSESDNLIYEIQLSIRILLHDAKDLNHDLQASRKLLYLCFPQTHLDEWDPWTPRDFYDSVLVPDRNDRCFDFFRADALKVQLYPFQKRTVKWLLFRERYNVGQLTTSSIYPKQYYDSFCHGFIQTVDADGRNCYVSHFLGVVTTNQRLVVSANLDIKGGILAEQMGLGKTVEMIALICLHQASQISVVEDSTSIGMDHTSATLIITPPSILQQWKDELQRHSPDLKVMVYGGLRRTANECSDKELMGGFAAHDVVLATYPVLASEIHYAPAPNRDLRHGKKYQRRVSPVTQIIWWRVVLDEAQMIESGINNAAKMAQLIPRQNAWALSGTPVRKDAKDLLGLLIFLRYEPFNHMPKLWDFLVSHHRDLFKQLFGIIALRHTKDQIKGEIHLPPQKRVVITIPFTQIEEQHYSNMYQQMCDDCGFDTDGCPITGIWDSCSVATIEKMRIWLTRLRQTCLHPEVGKHNRRALGSSKGPLRTVKEVLEVMMEHNEVARRTEERALLLSQIRRGQIFEHANRSQDALRIWLETLAESKLIVESCRLALIPQLGNIETQQTTSEGSTVARTGVLRQRLRSALEVEHVCTFFVANAYYQIKSDVIATPPDSIAFKQLEKAEEDTYERAKVLRTEMLTETHGRAATLMSAINAKAEAQSFVAIISQNVTIESSGIESRNIIARSNKLLNLLQDQSRYLAEWREILITLLLQPLVDEEEAELKGNEYEASKKQQDEIYVYMDALRAGVADRHEALTGQNNLRVDHEMNSALNQANRGEGHSPTLRRNLLHIRATFKSVSKGDSLRGIVTELRDLRTTLRSQVERPNSRVAAEILSINPILQKLNNIATEHTKTVACLGRELELFKDAMNARLEYYRQLQQISDSVAPYEVTFSSETLETTLTAMQENENKIRTRINSIKSQGRYLLHLRDDATLSNPQRMCIICQQPYETGVLTSCGHSYCVECLRLWWGTHRNCPTCKKHLNRNEFHQITYKPREFVLKETSKTEVEGKVTSDPDSMSIYSGVNNTILNQIKNIEIDGSFGTKIDTLGRHILWIREHDPGAKSIIFSQFKDFLAVLAKAFSRFKIGFTGIDTKDGIQKFKADASLECFFLHAKAHSSGLNLVNATHVFLCEPLMNTAIELQAIARVHRIGQHQPTTVWMYLVDNTVEKSIYEISVARRMSHIESVRDLHGDDDVEDDNDNYNFDKSNPFENKFDAANSLEIQQTALSKLLTKGSGGGELVAQDDLWECLFHQKKAGPPKNSIMDMDS